MIGNAFEYCQDWYGGDYSSDSLVDPIGTNTPFLFFGSTPLHVWRGGDMFSERSGEDIRSASRLDIHSGLRFLVSIDYYNGFRVVRSGP